MIDAKKIYPLITDCVGGIFLVSFSLNAKISAGVDNMEVAKKLLDDNKPREALER